MGPSIKYVTLFLANFHPLPPVTLCHTSRHPPKVRHTSRTPIFSRSSTKNPDKRPCTNSLSIVCGVFCPGCFVRGGFCPFPLLSEYICYNRKLNITLNFMFHIYDKKCISGTSLALDPFHLSQTVTLSRTPSPSSVTYFMDGPCPSSQN